MGFELEQEYERLKHENPKEYERLEKIRKEKENALRNKKPKLRDFERDER